MINKPLITEQLDPKRYPTEAGRWNPKNVLDFILSLTFQSFSIAYPQFHTILLLIPTST